MGDMTEARDVPPTEPAGTSPGTGPGADGAVPPPPPPGSASGSGPGSASARSERITRPGTGRVFAGVCAGTAEHLGFSVKAVRWAFVIAAFIGGAGIVAYGLLWAFTPVEERTDPDAEQAQERARRSGAVRLVVLGVLVILFAALLILAPASGLTTSQLTLMGGLMAVAAGLYLAWTYLDHVDLLRSRGATATTPGGAGGRFAAVSLWLIPLLGIALVVGGVLVLAVSSQGLTFTWNLVLATVAVLVGIGIVLMPWGVRMWRRFVSEQEIRIRETERADIAAHLHDSVLQTLALIQRTDDVARVKVLARAQERELRRWLYGGADKSPESLAAAVTEIAHLVEDDHGVPIDLVVTGDRPLDEDTVALVRALREALLNAVRHGDPPVSAYVEVGKRRVEAFVRDHGPGFDLTDVPEDRFGVKESIIGRMQRAGGSARIRRLENGTEVELTLDVAAAQPGEQPSPPDPTPDAAQPPDPTADLAQTPDPQATPAPEEEARSSDSESRPGGPPGVSMSRGTDATTGPEGRGCPVGPPGVSMSRGTDATTEPEGLGRPAGPPTDESLERMTQPADETTDPIKETTP